MNITTLNMVNLDNSKIIIRGGTPEGGGGGGDTPSDERPFINDNDVTFHDYDGVILYSYTRDEFLALTEMPELPTQPGLTCLEWNWGFEDAQEYVGKYGKLIVGASYTTDDGSTRIHIDIPVKGRMTFNLPITLNTSLVNSVLVSWGDGVEEVISASITVSHTYNNTGKYVISLKINPKKELTENDFALSIGPFSNSEQTVSPSSAMIYKIEYGNNSFINQGKMTPACVNLQSVVLPRYFLTSNKNNFGKALKALIFRNNAINSIGEYAFQRLDSLEVVSLPSKGIKRIPSESFSFCERLRKITIPPSVTQIDGYAFNGASNFSEVIIPEGVTTIGGTAFANTSISSVKLPASLTTFQSDAFDGTKLRHFDYPKGINIYVGAFTNCENLSSFNIPEGIERITNSAFRYAYSLFSLKFPSTINLIASDTFKGCTNMGFYDFSSCTVVPTLEGSAFSAIPADCKIIVPDALYDEWTNATNWSNYARYIIKKSDWDAL